MGQADETQDQNDAESLDTIRAQRDEYLAGWKRALADYENFKREQAERLQSHISYRTDELSSRLLPIIDLFDQALAHIPDEHRDLAWFQGLLRIKQSFDGFLKEQGIEEVHATGAFDPERHEAIETANDANADDNAIIRVVERGYHRNGNLIRPAKVIVNTKNNK